MTFDEPSLLCVVQTLVRSFVHMYGAHVMGNGRQYLVYTCLVKITTKLCYVHASHICVLSILLTTHA